MAQTSLGRAEQPQENPSFSGLWSWGGSGQGLHPWAAQDDTEFQPHVDTTAGLILMESWKKQQYF